MLKSCATRVCCACGDEIICVAVQYLTLRIDCERHGRKNPLPYPISERSHVGNLRWANKQGKGRSSKRKGNRRCPFLFAPRGGRRLFAQTEGIIPAPESCHAIAATIREALKAKEEGKEKVILFCLSGHGLIDMPSYDSFINGDLHDYSVSDEEIQQFLKDVPKVD